MANRPKGYGLSRELADKVAAKYSMDDEQEIVSWLCDMTRTEPPEGEGHEFFKNWLRDGMILCALMDILEPGICHKPHNVSGIRLKVSLCGAQRPQNWEYLIILPDFFPQNYFIFSFISKLDTKI